jgi:catechol 2,3-dioxygenase-like lactoylglutathione lyase family enzyme
MDLNQVTVVCSDYDASVTFYRALGLTQIVDSPPRYARFETPAGTTLSIHQGATVSPGTVIYFEVEDVDATVNALQAKGLEFDSGPVDQDWLWREAYLRDPAGNRLCIYSAGKNRRYPPWRMATERNE